jgi:hypothetical protein
MAAATHTATRRAPRSTRGRKDTRSQLRPASDSVCFDREYWLAHCEGFRVDAAGGRLGFVEAIAPDPRANRYSPSGPVGSAGAC